MGLRDSLSRLWGRGGGASSNAFRTVDGVSVADLSGVSEGFSVSRRPDGAWTFTVNVSAPRVGTVFRALSQRVAEPGFFVLETGSSRDVEEGLRTSPTDSFHDDVHYLDGITVARAHAILTAHEPTLVHDGLVNFGFGSHTGTDEVFVGPYKIFSVHADAPDKYREALAALGFEERARLKTVWGSFRPDAPGSRVTLGGALPTPSDVVEALRKEGLYLAERRES